MYSFAFTLVIRLIAEFCILMPMVIDYSSLFAVPLLQCMFMRRMSYDNMGVSRLVYLPYIDDKCKAAGTQLLTY